MLILVSRCSCFLWVFSATLIWEGHALGAPYAQCCSLLTEGSTLLGFAVCPPFRCEERVGEFLEHTALSLAGKFRVVG